MNRMFAVGGAVVIVVLAFLVTLGALNYWGSGTAPTSSTPSSETSSAVPSTPSAPPPSSSTGEATRVYSLSIDSGAPNWTKVSAQTTTQTSNGALVVTSDAPANAYELATDAITTTPSKSYVVEYDINVSDGTIAIGALDVTHDKWIVVHPVTTQHDSFQFSATSDVTKIVITKNSTPQTNATIANLAVTQQ